MKHFRTSSFPTRLLFRMAAALLLTWGLALSTAQAQTVNWVNWTAPGAYPYTSGHSYTDEVSGSLTLPDSSVVNVTLTGEVMALSCFTANVGDCPDAWWRGNGWAPPAAFTSAHVPAIPPNGNLIAQTGLIPAVAQHTLTFSQPVTNIVMNIVSLGGGYPNPVSAYQFDQDFTILSQAPGCDSSDTSPPVGGCFTAQGRTLTGNSGSGTIQFSGTFTSISWDVTVAEFYSGFNVGVTSASFTAQNALALSAAPANIPLSGTSTLGTSGGSGSGAVVYTLVSGPCTLLGNTLTSTGSAGSCVVTATKAGDDTYTSATTDPLTILVGSYSVTYDANGATSGTAPAAQNAPYGTDATLAANPGLAKTGYVFAGWNTAADGSGTDYAAGSTYTANTPATLYAKWTALLPPTVTAINPAVGSTAGGTVVTITGTDFTGATAVTIGANVCTAFTVVSATSITCTVPAGTAGTASVVVTTPQGSNAANTLFSYLAVTDTGTTARGAVRADITGGTCVGYENGSAQFSAPNNPPAGLRFPYGVFGFTVQGCGLGGSVTITLTYPQNLPAGTRYWKEIGGTWVDWTSNVTITGNTIVLTLTDGASGDTNPQPGVISDPGGPAFPMAAGVGGATAIPTLSEWALLALSALMALVMAFTLRRQQVM